MPTKSSRGYQKLGYQELIENSKVMTIATCDNEGPWSAPVYYLFTGHLSTSHLSTGHLSTGHWFYFFSNPDARHIKMAKNQLSSVSIFQDDPCFRNLQGIQMSGKIKKASLNAKSITVAKKYCRRFKIKANDVGILDFFSLKFHASLYRFEPDIIYYMDNTRGLGNRERIKL